MYIGKPMRSGSYSTDTSNNGLRRHSLVISCWTSVVSWTLNCQAMSMYFGTQLSGIQNPTEITLFKYCFLGCECWIPMDTITFVPISVIPFLSDSNPGWSHASSYVLPHLLQVHCETQKSCCMNFYFRLLHGFALSLSGCDTGLVTY